MTRGDAQHCDLQVFARVVTVLGLTFKEDVPDTRNSKVIDIVRELESFAATRVRKLGRQTDRTTGNLVAARFTHTTSRALDPLHSEVLSATQWAHAATALAIWMLLPLLIGTWRITRREVAV